MPKRREAGWLILTLCMTLCAAGNGADDAQQSPKPQRILALSPALAEIVYAVGAGDRVAGVSQFTTYPPEAAEKPDCGGLFNPNLERILALRPDLILLQGKQEKIERLCGERKIPYEQIEIETIADIKQALRRVGRLTGEQEQAETVCQKMDQELKQLRQAADAINPRPRVFIVMSRREGSLAGIATVGGGTFIHEVVETAGGENIFADQERYPTISKETLLARQPDVIIELRPGEEMTDARRAALCKDWEPLSALPAVKNGRIEFLTGDSVLMPTPRIVQTIRKIQQLLIAPDSDDADGANATNEIQEKTDDAAGN
ncbi:ABC transporter substrate-binding protein [Candidatus Sumerlaeota bacterium]|nr:ABC transporter substrate-binding protein [Candidatus Sumerlaeota bacterium]